MRVLAVQSEPAELIADPDADPPRAALTALAVEPGGAPIEVKWALCTVQGTIPSPALECPGAQGIDFASDAGIGQLDLGVEPFRSVYRSVLNGGAGFPPEQVREVLKNGIPLVVGFRAQLDAARRLDGVTTVTLRSPDAARPVNRNPAIASLLADTEAIAPDGTTSVPLAASVRLTPIAAEGAHEPTAGGPEKLNYSFYATGGTVRTLRSADTTATGQPADPAVDWTAPAEAGPVQLWVVVRDGRGGAGWIARTVQVR